MRLQMVHSWLYVTDVATESTANNDSDSNVAYCDCVNVLLPGSHQRFFNVHVVILVIVLIQFSILLESIWTWVGGIQRTENDWLRRDWTEQDEWKKTEIKIEN